MKRPASEGANVTEVEVLPVLFISFDAKKSHVKRNTAIGVPREKRARNEKPHDDEEYYEEPGVVMTDIYNNIDAIVRENVKRLQDAVRGLPDKGLAGEGYEPPKVIFLSELLIDETLDIKAVKKNPALRVWPQELNVKDMKLKWVKKGEVGAKPEQKIAAYVRSDVDTTFLKVSPIAWTEPNNNLKENVLMLSYKGITIAGVHLTSKNCEKSHGWLEKAFGHLAQEVKDHEISLLIGDFNMDACQAFKKTGGELGGEAGRASDDINVKPASSSHGKAFYTGVIYPMNMKESLTDCLSLRRSMDKNYWSDHPPIFVSFKCRYEPIVE